METKPKKSKPSQVSQPRIVCELPGFWHQHKLPENGVLNYCHEDQMIPLLFEIRQCKLKRTDEEKRLARSLYTKEYTTRPNVQEKIRARLADPAHVQRRKEYAARPEVKERKKECSRRNREIRRRLKEEQPRLYSELAQKVQSHAYAENVTSDESAA